MTIATQPVSYNNAKQMNTTGRKQLALASIQKSRRLTELAEENKVSRKFIYQQQNKALAAVNDAFASSKKEQEKILFYLPVTFSWLCQFILCLVLNCRGSHRGIQKTLSDIFDYSISLGTIHMIIEEEKIKSVAINAKQDLSNIKLAAQDEIFHLNKPILSGIDLRSLYCYLLSQEEQRDFGTWGTHLLDLQKQGFNPSDFYADAADEIYAACEYVYPKVPYHYDHFHVIKDLMDLRRYFRNCLKTAVSNREMFQEKLKKKLLTEKMTDYSQQFIVAQTKEQEMKVLSQSIDTLVSWMQHDVLNKAGLDPVEREKLFDFILEEFNKLALQHPHRINAVCTTLKNQKEFLLSFTNILDSKFQLIAAEFVFPIDKIWEMCMLQRCKHSGGTYAIRSLPLQDYFENEFDAIEDAVLNALDTTERSSSMIENFHSRISPYFFLRREIGNNYLELLRFYLNHVPFQRSEREERLHKSPAEILTGKPHIHWLEMLGYQRFKQAA